MRTVFALLLLVSAGAHAWQVFVGVTSETTFRGSTETTSAANREERAEEDERARRRDSDSDSKTGASAGTQCINDDECYGYCDGQRCVDRAPSAPNVVQPASPVEPEPDPRPATPLLKCVSTDQCPSGLSCTNGQCLSAPPPPPSSALWKRGSELYLRERTVQLRQDLALGEGPVISSLATMQGVSAAKLGQAMRADRSKLIELMGDGSDSRWTSRFLARLEGLCVQPVSVSAR